MRFLVLAWLVSIHAFGCALCALYTPTSHVSLAFSVKDDTFEEVVITWEFSKEFTAQTLQNYDKNGNGTFEEEELRVVKEVLLEYIGQRNHLTQLSYYIGTQTSARIPLHVKDDRLWTQSEQLFYTYTIPFALPLEPSLVLKAEFYDQGGFFDFRIAPQSPYKITPQLWVSANINNFVGYFEFNPTPTHYPHSIAPLAQESSTLRSSWLAFLEEKLKTYSEQIKTMLQEATRNPSLGTLAPLLLVSFLYGLFHAAGPGHGKTLVGSYYLARGGRWSEALWLSVRIGVVHVLGAFLLVLVSFYGVQTFVSKLLSDVTLYTTRIAATFIILIGFWMLGNKFFNRGHDHHCGCSACKPRTGWGIVLAAGMVPCPGTVVIFILTFTLGSYLAGFLGAVSMALGMSTVIFSAALAGQSLGTLGQWKKLSAVFEFLAIGILLVLGTLMLLGSFA